MSRPANMAIRAREAVKKDGSDAATKYDANDASTHMKSAGIPPRVGSRIGMRHVIKTRVDYTCCK